MKLLHLGIEEVEILRHGYEVMEKIFDRIFFLWKALEGKIRIMANGKNGVKIDKDIS